MNTAEEISRMEKLKRHTILHSLQDVIRILENEPVRGDLIVSLPIVQTLNRVSIAHLSIERAMKFLITEAGGPLVKDHDLPSRLKELRQHEPESAEYLEVAFDDAVRHYRYNANAAHMKHLKSLGTYMDATGSDNDFQDIRYWELTQSTSEVLIRQIYLTLHMELLYALKEILLARPSKDTVSDRVERATRQAMFSSRELSYSAGSEKEGSVQAYINWLRGFNCFREAITQAVKEGLANATDFILEILSKAHQELLESNDPAVRYFAETLTVLPKQQRDAIPCVEWLGPKPFQSGMVSTPGGEELGFINRRLDGLWAITPSRDGPIMVTAIAETQTDARCYLANLLTRPAQTIVNGDEKHLRIVGEEHNVFNKNYELVAEWYEQPEPALQPTYEVEFWDDQHGINGGDSVKLEVPTENSTGIVYILEGTVTRVSGHKVFISGIESFGTDAEYSRQD